MAKNFVSNKDETVRMFNNNFLESLSRVHPSVPIIIYLPIIAYMLYLAVWQHQLHFLNIAGLFLFGIFIWSITEYTLHRFVFHFRPKSQFGEKVHFIFHGVHHDYPNDSRRLVMPPSVSIPLALLFFILFSFILGNVLVLPFFAGFLLGYLFYDITHYAIHHFNMHSKYWLAIKNHHMKHHYQDSTKGFGVSTPIWDSIVGSNFPEKKEN
ncbi:MAG TPA: sterol desaturase family protein [Ignavibacteriaceae bacterium]|nr:sterol desaturase family protein [Ignavibacteriaceae bacterium]